MLSKARSRRDSAVFETIFAKGVSQPVRAGLVNGRTIHMDGRPADANASNNSVCKGPVLFIERLRQELRGEMVKLDEPEPPSPPACESDGTDLPPSGEPPQPIQG